MISWAVGNPLYAFAALVGLAVGIFYGFDGWSGDTENVPFQDSKRVKNLIWVLGPGVVAFFGDSKALNPQADRSELMLAYFAPCLFAGVVVVIFWGLTIGVGQILAVVRKTDSGYGVADAVGDYFFYGYRHYRSKAETAKEVRSARFHAAYRRQLAVSITAAGSLKAGTEEIRRLEIARTILKSILAVVQSYHNDDQNSKRFRASIMLARPCEGRLRESLLFVGEGRATVSHCLHLVTYDTDESQSAIAIPLPDSLTKALPGAPTACLSDDGIDVIDDTAKIAYRPAVPRAIQAEIDTYFTQSHFKSFGSVRIIAAGVPLGVVNVDARTTNVFGQTPDEKQRIAEYLIPFCATLGVVFSPLGREQYHG
jgi:hypothetical protein